MFRGQHCTSTLDFVPDEYKPLATSIFDDSKNLSIDVIEAYAEGLQSEGDFKKLYRNEVALASFLKRFKKNFSLLVEKTWVDQLDIVKKETLQARLPAFFNKIEKGAYMGALHDLNQILNELAYLMFGNDCQKPDFVAYTFRIDPSMGLFWWYATHISAFQNNDDPELLRALLLLGICYITSL